uniref:Aldehyde dehydrogenase n=1 Tax=Neogobius melanostomus TaxID=47308 RepID=A0A8C6WTK3_9GOBI
TVPASCLWTLTFPRAALLRHLAFKFTQRLDESENIIHTLINPRLSCCRYTSELRATVSELVIVANEAHYALANLKSWLQPEYVSKNLVDTCYVRREPLGVALIIGPWNYPIHLLLLPLVGAIAAGNCVVIKPSEVTASVEAMFFLLMTAGLFTVVCGGAEETTELLKHKFDHIFYTGEQQSDLFTSLFGTVIIRAGYTGREDPLFLYGNLSMADTARRLAWSKFFNVGQSCVAPDYVLCTKKMRDVLVPALKEVLQEFYGDEPQKSPDLPRIVSPKHWSRLMGLLGRSKGTVVLGGESDEADKYIAPTVLVDVPEDDALMQEEIFGPILPILTVETLEEGINFINQRDKPLALYLFSDVASVRAETSSGAFVSNDGIIYMTLPSLPFGGVGASGFGNYHGRWGFETFSHRRAVMLRGWALERLNAMRYPPYNDTNLSWLRWSASPRLCSILPGTFWSIQGTRTCGKISRLCQTRYKTLLLQSLLTVSTIQQTG